MFSLPLFVLTLGPSDVLEWLSPVATKRITDGRKLSGGATQADFLKGSVRAGD
jgi:hypothetical protein